MDIREKRLYHQIHPAKLLTDTSAAVVALYFFWQHNIVLGLTVTFVPSIIVSILIVRYVNLEKQKRSPVGRYISKYMTTSMQILRLAGNGIMLVGAWFQIIWLILVGLVVVLMGWLHGLIFPEKGQNTHHEIGALRS